MNLAPIKYRNILEIDGGPLASLTTRLTPSGQFESFAYLRRDLRPSWLSKKSVYGNADGNGTDLSKIRAAYKSVSESLERWAFYSESRGRAAKSYGFDIDNSTSGMAAFPGIFAQSARRLANLEAIERWSIVAWWDGLLIANRVESDLPDVDVFELGIPWNHVSVVIIRKRSEQSAYAFAASPTRNLAIQKAMVELERNERVIRAYSQNQNPVRIVDVYEQRLIYFSGANGSEDFDRKIQDSFRNSKIKSPPKTSIDRELRGNWSKYCTVWRVLYEPTSRGAFNDGIDYFLF